MSKRKSRPLGWICERFPKSNVIVVNDREFQLRRTPRSSRIAKLNDLVRKRTGYVSLSVRKLYEQLNISTTVARTGMDELSANHSHPAMCMESGPDTAPLDLSALIRFEDGIALMLGIT